MEKVLCSSGSLTVEAPLSEHFFRHRWNKSLSTSGKLTGDWNQQVCRRNYYCENSAHPGVLTTSYKKQNRDFLIPSLPDATLPQENPAQHELRKMGMNWSSSSFHGSFFISHKASSQPVLLHKPALAVRCHCCHSGHELNDHSSPQQQRVLVFYWQHWCTNAVRCVVAIFKPSSSFCIHQWQWQITVKQQSQLLI